MSVKLRKIHACSYEWTIINLALCPTKPGKALYSPPFTSDLLGNTKWRLVLYPKGEENCEFMSLFIQRLDGDGTDAKEIVIDYKITLDSLDARFRFMHIAQDVCFEENDLVGHSEFARWDSPEFLDTHDVFVVHCEMSLSDRTASDGRWNQRLDFKAMSGDIECLFESGRHADFVLVSNGCEFRVHKAVLAARSPKFRRELKGVRCNGMDVSWIPPQVLSGFLSLVYSGKLDVPPNRVPPELITVAEEYEMNDLVWRILAFPKAYRARTLVHFEHKYVVWGFKVLGARESDRTFYRRSVNCDRIYCDRLIVTCLIVHDAERGNGDYITVTFTLRGFQPDRPVFLSMTVQVIDTKHSVSSIYEVFTGRYVFVRSSCWKQTFPIDDFPLAVGDTINLGFEFDVSDGAPSDYLESHDLAVPDRCPIGIDDLRYFSSEFRNLLDEDDFSDFSDFSVVCGSETFRVHRSVLAARSPVFDRMLEHDMVEKRTGAVVIVDIRPEVVKSMLSYMYGGVLSEDINCEDVKDLYAAADKYALFVLKERCHSLLLKNLNVVNVEDVLGLALLHFDLRLECAARRFIQARALDVICTI